MEQPTEMLARIDWRDDIPQAWIKSEEWKLKIKSGIDAQYIFLPKDALNGPVRIDRLLFLFQQCSDPSGIFAPSLDLTKQCLERVTMSWVMTCKPYDAFWWKTASICVPGKVTVKVAHHHGHYVISTEGFRLTGFLGSWFVADSGNGTTSIDGALVEFDIQLLVSHPDLITFGGS